MAGSWTVADIQDTDSVVSPISDDLVGFLGDRPFFYADQPSVADLSVYAMLRIMETGPMTNSATMVRSREPLTAYMKRMEALTSGGGSIDGDSLA